jgi:diguanylate cyclase (GGDEF)-like protein
MINNSKPFGFFRMVHKRISWNVNGMIRKLSALEDNLSALATDFSIIPQDDPRQALRIRRFLISLFIYILNMPLFYLAYYAGTMPLKAVWGGWFLTALFNIGLYVVFRTNLNKRMKDPSMTSVQICVASLVVMYAMFFAYEARGILFAVYVLILLFGIFRLDTLQFLRVTAFILATYGLDIFLLKIYRPEDVRVQLEIFQWFGLMVVLANVSIIGGNISALRRDLASSRKRLQASLVKIQDMAIHDDLTGFYNRRHLMELIENEHNRSARTGSTFSMAMLDLDKFKNINDTFGHQAGDELLITFSNIVRNVLRKTDFCGRYGGEEFLVVLTQTDIREAKVFAERMRSCVEECLVLDLGADRKANVTVSIGLAAHLKNESIDRTISRADEAMYKAKRNGRNRVEVSE